MARCPKRVFDAVAVVPALSRGKAKPNPAPCACNPVAKTCKTRKPTGKLTKSDRAALPSCAFADTKRRQYPIHDRGHASTAIAYIERDYQSGKLSARQADSFRSRARAAQERLGVNVRGNPGPSPGQKETTPMAKAKKARKSRAGKKRARTPAQKAATKRMLAANKAKRGGRAKKKPWGEIYAEREAKPIRRRRRKSGSAPKRKAVRKTSRRRASPRADISVQVPVSVGATRSRRAPAKRRRARKSGSPRRARKTTRRARKTTRRVSHRRASQHMVRFGGRASLTRKNPITSSKKLAVAVLFVGLGYGGATLVDRLLSTRDKGNGVAYGSFAVAARAIHPDYVRVGAVAGGTLALGGAAYLLRRKSEWASVILGGTAVGFGVKALGLGLSWLLPKVLPVADQAEATWTNRLLPEDSAAFEPVSTVAGAPWNRQVTGSVGSADFGPVASGNVGCGCGCGGDEPHRPSCGCPKARTPQASATPPESAGAGSQLPTIQAPNVSQLPGLVVQMPQGIDRRAALYRNLQGRGAYVSLQQALPPVTGMRQ